HLQERINRLVDDLETMPDGPARETVRRRLAERNGELIVLRQKISEARETLRATDDPGGDIKARFAQARTKMNSGDAEQRRDARREVAAQYQCVIEQITLHEDRTLAIEMKPRDGIKTNYRLSQEALIRAEISTEQGPTITVA